MKTKPKPLKIKPNTRVRVRLTEEGKAMYQAHFIMAVGKSVIAPDVLEDNFWYVAHIFADVMAFGHRKVFKGNMIEVIEE